MGERVKQKVLTRQGRLQTMKLFTCLHWSFHLLFHIQYRKSKIIKIWVFNINIRFKVHRVQKVATKKCQPVFMLLFFVWLLLPLCDPRLAQNLLDRFLRFSQNLKFRLENLNEKLFWKYFKNQPPLWPKFSILSKLCSVFIYLRLYLLV